MTLRDDAFESPGHGRRLVSLIVPIVVIAGCAVLLLTALPRLNRQPAPVKP